MTISLLFALVLLGPSQEPKSFSQLPLWKAYQARIEKVYAIEVSWTESHTSKSAEKNQFELKYRKPAMIVFEAKGQKRLIWSGDAGLELDLEAKTYKHLKARPQVSEAWFLGSTIANVPFDVGGYTWSKEVTAKNDPSMHAIEIAYNGIDYSTDRLIWFEGRTHLINEISDRSWGMGPNETVQSRFTRFDVQAMIPLSEFELKIPPGFKPQGSGRYGRCPDR